MKTLCSTWKVISSVLYVNPIGTHKTGFHTSKLVHTCAVKTNELHRDQGRIQNLTLKPVWQHQW